MLDPKSDTKGIDRGITSLYVFLGSFWVLYFIALALGLYGGAE